MNLATLGAARSDDPGGRLSFRTTASLAAYDAVFVDLDAVIAEYLGVAWWRDHEPLLDVPSSQALLADARRWRDTLADYAMAEHIVLAGWSRVAAARVHTVHDIVRFGLADLFPHVEPRLEPLFGDEPTRLDCGEPFSTFFHRLGKPQTARLTVQLARGETLMRAGGDAPVAAYRMFRGSHLVVAPVPDGSDRLQRIESGISYLLDTLCSARHSRFVPGWASRMELPGERDLLAELASLDAEAGALKARIVQTRSRLESLTGLKVIAGGSPAQAAVTASQRLRVLGGNLLRDFEHENAFVIGLDRGLTLLIAFADPDDRAAAGRVLAMRERYRYEFDGDAEPVLFVLASPDRTAGELASASPGVLTRPARDLLGILADEGADLSGRIRALLARPTGE